MAKQDRAIRTRRRILEAAAAVFEQQGYQAATIAEILKAAEVTKGALYFHFESKDDLVRCILNEQHSQGLPQPQSLRLQELVDSSMILAYRLRTDPLVRASVRLTLDRQAEGLDQRGPFQDWSQHNRQILEAAGRQGELLPHVDPAETAEVLVGAFAGVQLMSYSLTHYQDLPIRLRALHQHLFPSFTLPAVLTAMDFGLDRAEKLIADSTDSEP
ncbi:ScbR family autoregulator-binding transcription factor [Kitasatospora azatica]|uniref:ScbR family autoregulator-binding transcription factor n=1 Tax=Kitasatospora azatica TaxID=58347 RepID=UPI00056697CE|nr:ScbR family autoregulator-binding transcription factor [Kitasatospora azatica]